MESPRKPLRQEWLTWADVEKLVDVLLSQLRAAGRFDEMVMITRGGIVPGGLLSEALDISSVLIAAVDFPQALGHGDLDALAHILTDDAVGAGEGEDCRDVEVGRLLCQGRRGRQACSQCCGGAALHEKTTMHGFLPRLAAAAQSFVYLRVD